MDINKLKNLIKKTITELNEQDATLGNKTRLPGTGPGALPGTGPGMGDNINTSDTAAQVGIGGAAINTAGGGISPSGGGTSSGGSSASTPGFRYLLRSCNGGSTLGNTFCYDNGSYQTGDILEITGTPIGNFQNSGIIGRRYFVKSVHGSCSNIHWFTQPITAAPGECRNCCFSSWGGSGNSTPSGACIAANNGGFGCCINGPNDPSCPSTPTSNCDQSAWSNYNNWTNQFQNNYMNASWINNPNQPCQFLNNRIAHWNGILSGGVGPVQANQLHCKIEYTTNTLLPQHNC